MALCECQVGDIVKTTVFKTSSTQYYTSTVPDWEIGKTVTVKTVYNDGDIYAYDEYNNGRLLKQGEFEIMPLLSGDFNGRITIRNNVGPKLVYRHFQRLSEEAERIKKEKDEAEKKKRDEYEKIYGTRYPTYYQLHPEASSSQYQDYSDSCQVWFYEWSDLDSLPRRFYNMKAFLAFLRDSGIWVNDEEIKDMKRIYYIYATCVPGSTKFIYSSYEYGLRQKFNDAKSFGSKVILVKENNENSYLIDYAKKEDNENLKSFAFSEIKKDAVIFNNKDEAEEAIRTIGKATQGFVKLKAINFME